VEEIPFEETIVHLKEVLELKYANSEDLLVIKKLLRGKDSKTIAIKIDDFDTIAIHFKEKEYSITIGEPKKFVMRTAIPYRDLVFSSMGKLPIKSFLKGKIRFRGSIRDALIVQKLFFIPLGDPDAVIAYFQHYFLGEN
jgi:hypothetical protein